MTSYQNIIDDLKASMLSKDALKTSTLRMLKADLMKIEKSGAGQEIDEETIVKVTKKLVKQRKESADQFRKADRDELADKEEAEIVILQAYLPEEISEDAIREVVKSVIADLGASDKSMMGQVMGASMGKLKGQADGSLVKKVVEEELS